MNRSATDLKTLLDLLLDQECDDAQRERIEELLAQNPPLLDQYIAHMRLHSMLQWHCDTPAALLPEEEPATSLLARPVPVRRRFSRSRMVATVCATAAAVLLLAMGLTHSWFVDDAPPSIGWVSDAESVIWSEDQTPIEEGASFGSGEIRTRGGLLELQFQSGATLQCRGPGVLEVLSGMRVRVVQGKVSVRVSDSAKGFVIETPDAEVIDLGTEFGVAVRQGEHTDVVVFDGEVDVQRSAREVEGRQRLTKGEAIRVDNHGKLQRVMQVTRSAETGAWSVGESDSTGSVVHRIGDNLRTANARKYYEIVPNGFREGVRAYVDRGHLWKSMNAGGMPEFLQGADYIKTFNRDRHEGALEIRLSVTCPGSVYVLYNDKSPIPPWLEKSFSDTGADIGLDIYPRKVRAKARDVSGLGKGIDAVFSVWRLSVQEPGEVVLGSVGATQRGKQSMYGSVVAPTDQRD